jgi:beta-glucosidase
LLCGFNGGQFGGEALAKVIFGLHNPVGKLPISFPYHVGQQPSYYAQNRGWHGGKYCDMPKDFLFAFGEGMSYTTYKYSEPVFDKDTLTLTLEVENTGKYDGTEIVQVYMHDPFATLMIPKKQLIAFKRVPLAAGERKSISFNLSYKDFSFVNANCQRVCEKGEFVILVGPSSKDDELKEVRFELSETLYL